MQSRRSPGSVAHRHARADATQRLRAVLASDSTVELTGALDDVSPEVARAAVKRLVEIAGPGCARELRARLLTAELSLVGDLATALRAIGDQRAVEDATAGLRDERYQRRLAAAMALGALRDRRAAGALRAALEDPIAGVRAAALAALANLGDDATSVEAGARLLDDPDMYVRIAAIRAVARIAVGPGPHLEPLARDRQPLVRLEVARHLPALGDDVAAGLLADPDRTVREAAAHAAGRAQIAWLAQLLGRDPAAGVRHAAADRIGRIGDRADAERLIGTIEDPDAIVRAAALRSLQQLLTRRGAIDRLSRELCAERPGRRRAGLYALAHLKAREAHDEVTAMAEDVDPHVRLALLEVIGELLAEPAPVIRRLVDDDDPYVRHSAEIHLLRQATTTSGEAIE
jgi:HEAT repeat protein